MMQIVPKLLSDRELNRSPAFFTQDHIFQYMACGQLYSPQYFLARDDFRKSGIPVGYYTDVEAEIAAIEIQLYLRMAGCLDSQVPG